MNPKVKKIVIGIIIGALVAITLAWILGKMKPSGGQTSEGPQIPFDIPPSYTSFMHPSDVVKYGAQSAIEYEVRKVSPTQIDLVSQVGQEWQAIIRFDPSQKPPFVAHFEKVNKGVYKTAMMKLTPNQSGGFDYVHLEEGIDPIRGTLRPNWYN